jgi:outer membrane biosynthesis protein TonB
MSPQIDEMIHPDHHGCTQNCDQAQSGPDLRRARARPAWFWLSLTGGSIAVHILLIHVVQAESLQQSRRLPAITPIEFVDLPAAPLASGLGSGLNSSSGSSQSDQNTTASKTRPPVRQAASQAESGVANRPILQSPQSPAQSSGAAELSQSAQAPIQTAQQTAQTASDSPIPPPSARIAAAALSKPTLSRPAAGANSSIETDLPDASDLGSSDPGSSAANSASTSESTSEPASGSRDGAEQLTSPTPDSGIPATRAEPQIMTERIEVPIPDISKMPSPSPSSTADSEPVDSEPADSEQNSERKQSENVAESPSESLPEDLPEQPATSAEATPETTPETATNQLAVPVSLTASLTTDAAPLDTNQPLPDETAQPKTEVKRISGRSPCRVTPEVVRFLGKTVALQVATDETGQVVETVTQESSENPAYDRLATCLVENWEFSPAIAQGEAVANDGLVVRITIDRS